MKHTNNTILGSLLDEKNTKLVTVKAKIPEEVRKKISVICENTNVKEDEYLGKILESSEIDKVYKMITKEKEKSEKITSVDETDDEKINE